jgi:alpha-D-ribose 1-methylphosphonate 5-triphosphate diphosphatase PhnM
MMKEGLVDIISTDYAGGLWDSELLLLDAAVREGAVDLPTAIAMATGNVTKVFPKLAPNRGLIEPGRVADVVVVNRDNIGKVKTVIIAGTVTVEDGKIKTPVR